MKFSLPMFTLAGALALASQRPASAANAPCNSTTRQSSYSNSYTTSVQVGNDWLGVVGTAGAGWSARGGTPGTGSANSADINGSLQLTGKFFHLSISLAKMIGKVAVAADGSAANYSFIANVAGTDLYSASGTPLQNPSPSYSNSWTKTFAETHYDFGIGFFNINLDFTLSGTAGFTAGASLTGTSGQLYVFPSLGVNGSAMAQVGAFCIFGHCFVTGSGTATGKLDASGGVMAALSVDTNAASWSMNAGAQVTASIGGMLSAGLAFGLWNYNLDLGPWTYQSTWPGEHEYSCVAPLAAPSCAAGYRDCGDGVCVKLPGVCP